MKWLICIFGNLMKNYFNSSLFKLGGWLGFVNLDYILKKIIFFCFFCYDQYIVYRVYKFVLVLKQY